MWSLRFGESFQDPPEITDASAGNGLRIRAELGDLYRDITVYSHTRSVLLKWVQIWFLRNPDLPATSLTWT